VTRICVAKKEAKRLEKETRMAAKTNKNAGLPGKKPKAGKDDKEAEPAFVNTTPKRQKKGE
jgi:valyl-tRNA synthetase